MILILQQHLLAIASRSSFLGQFWTTTGQKGMKLFEYVMNWKRGAMMKEMWVIMKMQMKLWRMKVFDVDFYLLICCLSCI